MTHYPLDDAGNFVPVEITNEFVYDALRRPAVQTVSVDGDPNVAKVLSDWTLAADGWTRTLTYPPGLDPAGTSIVQRFDEAGRLRSIRRDGAYETAFHWLGDLPFGRDQQWTTAAGPDPLRSFATYDGLGRRLTWRYTALDLGADGLPVDPTWADRYCLEPWNAERCGPPLLDIEAVRDKAGRIGSLTTTLGHPFVPPAADPERAHAPEWRGYAYSIAGRLTESWTGPLGAEPPNFTNDVMTSADVGAYAAARADLVQRTFEREATVGALVSIYRDGDVQNPLWYTASPRTDGHQLTEVGVDGEVYAVGHDAVGRITNASPDHQLVYDPLDRLVGVLDADGNLLEGYAYDALGRLTVVVDAAVAGGEVVVVSG